MFVLIIALAIIAILSLALILVSKKLKEVEPRCYELIATVEYKEQYIQAKHQKIAALENELAETMKNYIALTDVRVRLSNRIQELEGVVASQNYQLKKYEVTMADPKSLAAFIRWQAERRQQDQLLEVLTGGQYKKPTTEESLELAEKTTGANLSTSIDELTQSTTVPTLPTSVEDSTVPQPSDQAVSKTSEADWEKETDEFIQALSRPIVDDGTYKGA